MNAGSLNAFDPADVDLEAVLDAVELLLAFARPAGLSFIAAISRPRSSE